MDFGHAQHHMHDASHDASVQSIDHKLFDHLMRTGHVDRPPKYKTIFAAVIIVVRPDSGLRFRPPLIHCLFALAERKAFWRYICVFPDKHYAIF